MTVEKNLTIQEQHTYNTYLKSTRKNKGFTPRKNFDDIEDEKYIAIKKISATLRNKKIDPILFFEAPYIMHSERFVPLSYYSTFPAISVYRKYVREIELTKPDAEFNFGQNAFRFSPPVGYKSLNYANLIRVPVRLFKTIKNFCIKINDFF